MCVYELPINKIFNESEVEAAVLKKNNNVSRKVIIGLNMAFVLI
jgi:hypothetical protein